MRPRTPLWTACAWLSAAAPLARASFDCAAPVSLAGLSFDLSPLQGVHAWERESQTPPTVTKNRYALSLCSALPDPSGDAPDDDCPAGTRVCMRTFTSRSGLDDRVLSVVPIVTDSADLVPSQKGDIDPKQEWILEMGGGKYNGVDQRVKIDMTCDASAKKSEPTVDDYDPKAGILYLSWTTSAACPASPDGGGHQDDQTPPPNKGNDTKDDDDGKSARDPVASGFGFFGWFLTLLIISFAAYFVIGAYHNRTTYGATGWDMVPHRDVWRDLPYIVSDLFKGRGSSRNGYSALG